MRLAIAIGCLMLGACRPTTISFAPNNTYRIDNVSLRIGEKDESIKAAFIDNAFFSDAHAQPLIGRLFFPAEYGGASAHVAVISYSLWSQKLAKDPSWIGRKVPLNGAEFTIVGIMPEAFQFPEGV